MRGGDEMFVVAGVLGLILDDLMLLVLRVI
jgi:hypothetical protein